jgi:protein SCO1/2
VSDLPWGGVFVAAQPFAELRRRKDPAAAGAHTGRMTTTRISLLLLGVMAATVAVARGRGEAPRPAGHVYAVSGTVTAAPADGRVMVSHHDIPDYMPAMTMPFTLAPGQPHPRLAPGDTVRFRLVVGSGAPLAEGFVVTGHDAAVAAALASPPAAPPSSRLRAGDPVLPFALVDQRGEAFTQDRLRGRRTAVTFIFTRCPVPEFCPLMVQRFLEVERTLDRDRDLDDVQLVAITLDPRHDTPAVLEAYAAAKQVDQARWRLLTGSPDDVAGLTKAFAVHVEKNGVLLDHTLATAVIDADGRIVEIWRGNRWTAAEVVATLRGGRAPATE